MVTTIRKFFANLNELFAQCANSEASEAQDLSVLERVRQRLAKRLEVLSKDNPTFRDSKQSQWVLSTTFEYLLPAYSKYHRDLLFHQDEEFLFNSFFMGRVFEAILKSEDPRNNQDEFVKGTINQLNDFLAIVQLQRLNLRKLNLMNTNGSAPFRSISTTWAWL